MAAALGPPAEVAFAGRQRGRPRYVFRRVGWCQSPAFKTCIDLPHGIDDGHPNPYTI